jgi:hypothetical protein
MGNPQQFSCRFLLAFAAATLVMAVISISVDPFWLWQKEPRWHTAREGHNANLDLRTRLAKSLQIFTRPTKTVVIGSSRVYRGFSLATVPDGYNLGISSLRARELEGFTIHLLRWRKVGRLVIGLDYFMFDAGHPVEAGYDPKIVKSIYAPEALFSTLFSWDALQGARLAVTGKKGRDGSWSYNGYKRTNPYTAEKIAKIIPTLDKGLGQVVPGEEAYAAFDATLSEAQRHGTTVQVYLSPMHQLQFEQLKKSGAMDRFDAWKSRVKAIAEAHHVVCKDLTHPALSDDWRLKNGSTEYWIDPSHFSPKTAEWILKKLDEKDE